MGHSVAWRLSHYATSRKVAGSRPDEVNEFFPIYLSLPAALGSGVYSASNRNEYQKQIPGFSVHLYPFLALCIRGFPKFIYIRHL
jgi:hypothetical protein